MKTIFFSICLILAVATGRAADGIYVKAQDDLPAYLNNGGALSVAKGDCFPFIDYDLTNSLMRLKFGTLTFWVRKEDVNIVPESQSDDAAASYAALVKKAQSTAKDATSPVSISDLVEMLIGANNSSSTARAILAQLKGPLDTMIRQDIQKATAGSAVPAIANSFPVDAHNSEWQASGIWVSAGQHVQVEAAGVEKWDLGWGPVDANGYPRQLNDSSGVPIFHKGAMDHDWHWGALICAIGQGRDAVLDNTGDEIEIGAKRGFTVGSGGYLFFIANDNRIVPGSGVNGFDDNSGTIHIKITLSNQPNPPAGKGLIPDPGDSISAASDNSNRPILPDPGAKAEPPFGGIRAGVDFE